MFLVSKMFHCVAVVVVLGVLFVLLHLPHTHVYMENETTTTKMEFLFVLLFLLTTFVSKVSYHKFKDTYNLYTFFSAIFLLYFLIRFSDFLFCFLFYGLRNFVRFLFHFTEFSLINNICFFQ